MYIREIPQLPPRQPDLFTEQKYGPMAGIEPEEGVIAVSALAHLEDLRESLNHLSSMDASIIPNVPNTGFVESGFNPSDTWDVRSNNQKKEHEQAYAYFARAYGADTYRANGRDEASLHKIAWTAFQGFKNAYAGPRNTEKHTAYWRQLTRTIDVLRAKDPQIPIEETGEDRLLPRGSEHQKQLGEGAEREDVLTTREKLVALASDDRAGFLPTTHREKNTALTLLDYLDTKNPLFNGPRNDSIDSYLAEIYEHQVKESNKKYNQQKQQPATGSLAVSLPDSPVKHAQKARANGLDAVRSVINEWDDYRANALYSMDELSLLMQVANEFGSPTTTFAELLEDYGNNGNTIDPQPFLRYLDLKRFRDTGKLPGFDPLVTREIRPAPAEFASKNKLVVDAYFNVPDITAHHDEFSTMLRSVAVKTIREIVREAAIDSRKRHAFFDRVLKNVAGPYKTFADEAGQNW